VSTSEHTEDQTRVYTGDEEVVQRRVQIPKKFQGLFKPKRYKGRRGGRGGAKSWNFARALIMLARDRPIRVLCVRELQNSIAESVHRLLSDQISLLGLEADFDIQKTIIRSSCGSEFIFSGIQKNITKIKSMEGIDICWVEEAELISERSWEILIPTIRKQNCYIYDDVTPTEAEIWISWNPNEEKDPTHKRFVLNPPDAKDADIQEVNFMDNPFFPEVLNRERIYMERVDPDGAAHVWYGQTRKNSATQIFRDKYSVESFTPDYSQFSKWQGPYYGADWGFSGDPTVLMRCWIYGHKLFIEYESFLYNGEYDDISTAWNSDVPDCKRYTILADSQQPATINHVNKRGFMCRSVDKWPGSVEDGITYLKSFEKIIIHPRCKHMIDEARLYSYKADPLSGLATTIILDKHNHGWDSLRYALNKMIQKGGGSILDNLD
jgi:phage terminase large subunit